MSSGFTRTRTTPRDYELVGAGRAAPLNSIYVGFVKGVEDITSMGRLQVWIPELGGEPTDPNSWYTCTYASPFGGATNIYNVTAKGTTWPDSQRSYGMWFVPPDLNNEVVVCFINGDPGRGIWFACLYQQDMNQMVPGIPGNESTDTLPTVEYNKKDPSQINNPNRPLFSPLSDQLKIQGLDQDILRGVSTSGARRKDPPNAVYGILTPLQNQFVMDDNPGEAFIRLRTRTGVQVLLSDTDGSVYINSADGSNWLNMASDGAVEIYANGDISLRSQGSMNLRADVDVNIEAGRTINMKARNDTLVTNPSQPSQDRQAQGGNININANQNFNLTASNIFTQAGNTHARTAGNIFDTANGPPIEAGGEPSHWGNIYVKANGNIFINSNSNIAIQSIDNIFLETSNLIYMDATKSILVNSTDNITLQSTNAMIFQTFGNLSISTIGIGVHSDLPIVIASNESIWISSLNEITILSENDDIIIATDQDLWLSSENNTYLASQNDTTIHTGGMLAEYIHTYKKLEIIEVTDEDIIVPDIEPIGVDLSIIPPDLNILTLLTDMWATHGHLPIQPTDITQVDNQINGPGKYQQITRDTILYRLPYHEPYAYHSGTLVGTDSYVTENVTPGATSILTIDPVTGLPIPLGAIVPGATVPMNLIGSPSAGSPPGYYTGISYNQKSGLPIYSRDEAKGTTGLAPGSSYQLSQQGIQFLISYEGLNPLPYTDLGGQILIGVGHALSGDEISNRYTNVDGEQVPWEQGLSDSQIMSLLNQDLYVQGDPIKQQPVAQTVQQTISAQITQAQFDMLVDFCFNICPIPFMSSDVAMQINMGNFDVATNVWLNWNLLNGTLNQQIANRRRDEASRFRGLQTTL